MTLVFLLEELSMKEFLSTFLERIIPENKDISVKLIPHEGKSDLEKSIPRKLRAWKTPDTYFVVVRDKDSEDCLVVKERLSKLCDDSGRPDTLIRIACHELESWFIGDLETVGKVFDKPKLGRRQQSRKFRDPDRLSSPSRELKALVQEYGKVSGARLMGGQIDIEGCKSHSFQVFVSGLKNFIERILQP